MTRQSCEEETRRQLEYILDQLASPGQQVESGDISEEEEEEAAGQEGEIDIEEEVDECDPVSARSEIPHHQFNPFSSSIAFLGLTRCVG